jgi:hypothetical protein
VRATRVHLRGLALIVIVLATMAMHTGLSGACHVSASGARAVMTTSAADRGTHSAPSGPTAPADSSHAMAQVCQATLPSANGLTGALAAAGALTLVVTAPLPPGRQQVALRPWWPPPPAPSSLCIWRI